MDTIVMTQSIRNIMAGAGAILGPVAVFASSPAGIAVFGAILVAFIEREAKRIENLLANDPSAVTNSELMNSMERRMKQRYLFDLLLELHLRHLIYVVK